MKNIHTIIYIFILSCFFGCNSHERGIEGKWVEGKLFNIIVLNSEFRNYGDKTQLIVYWQVENTSKEPETFYYLGQYISDKDDRLFQPYDGNEVNLQPLEKSYKMHSAYYIPASINLKELFWGGYNGKQLEYKIKLNPQPYTIR